MEQGAHEEQCGILDHRCQLPAGVTVSRVSQVAQERRVPHGADIGDTWLVTPAVTRVFCSLIKIL